MGNNNIECKKLATIVSGRENVARPFFRRKQVSTSSHAYLLLPEEGSCYFFSTQTIVASFLQQFFLSTQSVIQSFLKTRVCGTPLSYNNFDCPRLIYICSLNCCFLCCILYNSLLYKYALFLVFKSKLTYSYNKVYFHIVC